MSNVVNQNTSAILPDEKISFPLNPGVNSNTAIIRIIIKKNVINNSCETIIVNIQEFEARDFLSSPLLIQPSKEMLLQP